MKQEQVNHPTHYNSHPAGIECIDIIRHYTCDIANALKYLWRAGLKPEMGKDDADKEIEDLKKALWYIEDYKAHCHATVWSVEHIKHMVKEVTGYSVAQISKGYEKNVSTAMKHLLCVGLQNIGAVARSKDWEIRLDYATECIQQRILDINQQLIGKEIADTKMVLQGCAVEGMDYAKPGGVREDEPDHYDPLNIIIVNGRAYSLCDEKREKPNGALYSPCDNCDLREECLSIDGSEQMKNLCGILHYAGETQYYREVGYCKYSPRYGTIEVVDEHKELQKELREMESEDEQ